MPLVPALTAGALMLLFFWLTDRWTQLENPVASQVTILCGVIGFLVGIAVQRITRWELVAIPGALTIGVMLWAVFAPHDSQEDREFREILWVFAGLLLVTTVAINIPQIARGHRPTAGDEQGA